MFGLILATVAFLEIAEREHVKKFVPPAYGPVWVKSSTSFSSGFGPGNYEAGLAFFTLPRDIASSISAEGVGWLDNADLSVKNKLGERVGEWLQNSAGNDILHMDGSGKLHIGRTEGALRGPRLSRRGGLSPRQRFSRQAGEIEVPEGGQNLTQ
ncbi:hypothetical protein [Pseudooceanicola sp. LIPI14-2-Ac024]|uniref:hypothetical protein n=1 Tax=Pseudooceanicola sp. LIPI14-2-Ac024 TaxID=3344875 RepID=UPI0035D0B2D9